MILERGKTVATSPVTSFRGAGVNTSLLLVILGTVLRPQKLLFYLVLNRYRASITAITISVSYFSAGKNKSSFSSSAGSTPLLYYREPPVVSIRKYEKLSVGGPETLGTEIRRTGQTPHLMSPGKRIDNVPESVDKPDFVDLLL